MWGCLSSVAVLLGAECGTVVSLLIFLLGGLCWASYRIVPAIYKRTYYRHHNLRLERLDHFPPGHTILCGLQLFPLQTFDVFLAIHGRRRWNAEKIAIRCLNKDYSNVPKDTIQVVSLQYWDDRYINGFHPTDDAAGGMGGDLPQIRKLRHREALYIKIMLRAQKPWAGVLSFRSVDDEVMESYARNLAIGVGMTYREAIERFFPTI